jgi:hypothetical protein
MGVLSLLAAHHQPSPAADHPRPTRPRPLPAPPYESKKRRPDRAVFVWAERTVVLGPRTSSGRTAPRSPAGSRLSACFGPQLPPAGGVHVDRRWGPRRSARTPARPAALAGGCDGAHRFAKAGTLVGKGEGRCARDRLLADMSRPYHRARHRTAAAARQAGQPLTCATAHRAGCRRG